MTGDPELIQPEEVGDATPFDPSENPEDYDPDLRVQDKGEDYEDA